MSVNYKVVHIRPEYKNIQEMVNKNHEYIGRKGIVFINDFQNMTQCYIIKIPIKKN